MYKTADIQGEHQTYFISTKSSHNKAQQAETYISSQRVSVAYKYSFSFL